MRILFYSPNPQQGFALVTTLVLLVMLSVLALSQVSSNSIQTQMATNSTDTEISFEKAEGALNEAINRMISNSYNSAQFLQNGSGLYVFNQNETPIWKTVNWDSSTSVIRSFSGLAGLQANFIIEQLPSVVQPGQNMRVSTRIYRVTGRAVGQNNNVSVLLQGTLQTQR